MDAEQKTRNHVSYIFSKETILRELLREGIISDSEFERYDQMLYDRYQMDASTGCPRPVSLPATQNSTVQLQNSTFADYISLTAAAKKVLENEPGYAVQSWLSDMKTIEYLHFWELKNNTDFKEAGYEALLEEMKNSSLTLTAKKWIETTNAIGLQSKMGKNGGTYAHPEIACAFCAWLRPEFQYSLVQSFLTEHRNWRPTE